jgi:hypothetical protein
MEEGEMKRRQLKRTVTALAVVVFSGALGATAMAQQWPGRNPHISRTEIATFDHYLDSHPDVAARLAADPWLVNDPRFVAAHPDFRAYLASHPGVREEIHESPGQFMYREGHYDWEHDQAHPLANTDHYLDRHPEVQAQLEHHPGLVDDPKYVASHPGLRKFLAQHPVARADWKSHPYRYMTREDAYDQRH